MYNIGNISFRYKKNAETHTRMLINKLGVCKITSTHSDYQFFVNLLDNHPDAKEKIGCGIDFFCIRNNPIGKGYQTVINRLDGSIEDFSWVYCCKFEKKSLEKQKQNAIADLKQAMRDAITEQINDFRENNELCCNYCSVVGNKYVYQVDHIQPFSELYEIFIKNQKTIPFTFGTNKNLLTCFNETDILFKNDWIDFHRKHATLQILCKDCNITKSNK